VTALYRDVLQRQPDAGGFGFWVASLDAGRFSRSQVGQFFLTSVESRTRVVEQFYQQILQRPSDRGRAFWIKGLVSGVLRESEVVAGFVTSVEFRTRFPAPDSFVQALYQRLLGRQPSAAEVSFQVNALNTGLSNRGLMAVAFLASDEAYVDAIHAYYREYLRRTPSFLEVQNWLGVLRSGTNPIDAQATFLGSPEYFLLVQQR